MSFKHPCGVENCVENWPVAGSLIRTLGVDREGTFKRRFCKHVKPGYNSHQGTSAKQMLVLVFLELVQVVQVRWAWVVHPRVLPDLDQSVTWPRVWRLYLWIHTH